MSRPCTNCKDLSRNLWTRQFLPQSISWFSSNWSSFSEQFTRSFGSNHFSQSSSTGPQPTQTVYVSSSHPPKRKGRKKLVIPKPVRQPAVPQIVQKPVTQPVAEPVLKPVSRPAQRPLLQPLQKPVPQPVQPVAPLDSGIQTWLQEHNKYRSQYGVVPLQWSEALVASSQRLTDRCVWHHTPNNPFGENIAVGQTSIAQTLDDWVNGPDEKDAYTPSNPIYSHFTQVIWKDTTEVGCSITTCETVSGANLPQSPVKFWACNYNPPGNVIGQFPENVKAGNGGMPL
ncbi:hypothetical protein O181_019253 [Austropuccinia psidii MF-1]|uniref:SCP domain-containing protein n=1 Tax=Austropuccinia psidii MF-1 TaxID=1389203 RepID=A0A9Q3C9B9_9BASI|nr:hypothetical protein [Austropuccinia psidii MF-1]